MTRQLMVVEPDPAGRRMLERVLTAAGYAAEGFESAYDARILLDDAAFDLAVVDELAGNGAALDEVRFLRERYPRLPVVVTGTMLSAPVLLELLRLGVADALPKPFTPDDVRDAAARALVRSAPRHDEALDYAAAVAAARRDLAAGVTSRAARAIARAWAWCPLDADVTALESLRAELEGRDADAARGYRATLALRDGESAEPPDPHEGLARLAAYGAARPVGGLDGRFHEAPLWLVTDPTRELSGEAPPGVVGPVVVVMALSLATDADARVTMHLRERPDRAFALLTSDLRPERAAPALARLGSGPLAAHAAVGASGVDVARLAEARDAAIRRRR